MHSSPDVSVVVPCHNKADFVAETLESVLAQVGVAAELVVVDNASTDGSLAVVAKYEDRVRFFPMEHNIGSVGARNFGAEQAAGDYLMFLDADDVLASPSTLASMVEAVRGKSDVVAACHWRKLQRIGDQWAPMPSGKPMHPPSGDFVADWLGGWYVPPCAILWPRTLYERSGRWREMGPWDDAEIMMRSLLDGTRIVIAEEGEAWYRILPPGSSLRSQASRSATQSRIGVLDTVTKRAEELGSLPRYARAIGRAYYELAQNHANPFPDLVLDCYRQADRLLGRRPLSGSPAHRLLWKALGLERKERLARWLTNHGLLHRRRSALDTGAAE